MKLHLKLHLTFIYAFILRFYSIACLSKLHSIITSSEVSVAHEPLRGVHSLKIRKEGNFVKKF